MAVPSNPTVTSIVTDALRHAGIFAPQSGQIAEMSTNGFQTVKTDIWAACAYDRLLTTTIMIPLSTGNGQLNTPDDFSSPVTLDAYGCDDTMAFTATAGGASTITAPTTFSADISSIRGRYIFTISGTGSGQYRQITSYDDDTKIVTIAPAWTVQPSTDTVAFIGQRRSRLMLDDTDYFVHMPLSVQAGHPRHYRIIGSSPLNSDLPAIEFFPVPDTNNYAMLLTYIPNLTRLDETGTIFVKHLRERRGLWIDGLIEQACRRYDEARYPVGYQTWEATLRQYSTHNHYYAQLYPAR